MEFLALILLLVIFVMAHRMYRFRPDKPPLGLRLLNTGIAFALGAPAGWALLMGPFQVFGALYRNRADQVSLGVAMIVAGACGVFLVGQVMRWVERAALRRAGDGAWTSLDADPVAPASRHTLLAVAAIGAGAAMVAVAGLVPAATGLLRTAGTVMGALASLLLLVPAAGAAVVAARVPAFRLWLGVTAVVLPPLAWSALGMDMETWGIALVVFGPVYVLVCVVPMLLYVRRRAQAARG